VCSDSYLDISSNFDNNWSTANTSIATADYYGTHTGHAVGSTTSSTWANLLIAGGHTYPCPRTRFTPGGGDNVKPTISGPSTLWWFNGLGLGVSGYTSQITLTANSGGTGTSYQWAITAGSNRVSLSTSTSATVQVTGTGQSSAANDVSITVTVGGITSDPFKLTVRAPYTLGTDPSFPTPVYEQDSTYVWSIFIYNVALDNFLTPMPSPVPVNEHWTSGVVPDYANENWRQSTQACDVTTAAAPAEFRDQIGGETPDHYPTPVYNPSQNGSAVYHWGQEIRVGTCTIGSGPRVQTDTIQKYTDHGAHTGITSPAP